MKFPDLVHAAKPEPHFAMPQAASAHDTFWDFASLMPEITHMLMWAMSDRAIPRSYRTMQGFGVNTYRLVNDKGESYFVKFHSSPKAGTHSLVWDEAVKISGADPDFIVAICGKPSRPVRIRSTNWGFRSSRRGRRSDSVSTCSMPPRSFLRNWCHSCRWDAWCSTGIPTTFSPRRSRWPSAPPMWSPASTFRTIPCWRDAFILRRYADSRLGGPNFHEIPINAPSRRCTTTSAMACTGKPSTAVASPTSRTRWVGMSLSSRRQGIRLVRRQDGGAGGQQAAGQARAVCRALRSGAPVPRQSDATRARAHHQRVSLRTVAGQSPRSGSGWCPA